MAIGQVIYGALSQLSWPCRLQNYVMEDDDDTTYTVYYLTGINDAVRASGASMRQVQRAQVSIYSTDPVSTDNIRTVVQALRAAGLRVTSFGSQAYDSASTMYNAPIMVEMAVSGSNMI